MFVSGEDAGCADLAYQDHHRGRFDIQRAFKGWHLPARRSAAMILEDKHMTIDDIGPQPQAFDLEEATRQNNNYRTVAWSGRYLQVTLMSIAAGRDIGLEMHPETDQFLRLDAGRGRVQIGPAKDQLSFEAEVSDGWCILVPAGAWHNVTNIGDEPMQIYAVYAPAHHRPGKIHRTSSEAAADENDEPAAWSVQPPAPRRDEQV